MEKFYTHKYTLTTNNDERYDVVYLADLVLTIYL